MDAAPNNTLNFTLTDEEAETLLAIDVAGTPGEALHTQVCQHLVGGNRVLPINEAQLGRLFRAMVWGSGPIQYMAAKIFKRSFTEMLANS